LIYQFPEFKYLIEYPVGVVVVTYWNGPFAAITMENRGQFALWCGRMDGIPLRWRTMRKFIESLSYTKNVLWCWISFSTAKYYKAVCIYKFLHTAFTILYNDHDIISLLW